MTYKIEIEVTIDDEGTHMGIRSDFNLPQSIEALERIIILLSAQDENTDLSTSITS